MLDRKNDRPRIVQRRFGVLLVLWIVLLGVFGTVLYDLQIVHGADFLERSKRKISLAETVEASRGLLLDSYGRVLVSNYTSYQVTLDTSLMGDDEQRNTLLDELLQLCRQQEVTWTDTLPISPTAPYVYTTASPFFTVSTDDEGTETRTLTRLGKLAVELEWLPFDPTEDDADDEEDKPVIREYPSATELVTLICEHFGLEKDQRDVAGVLYELDLRAKGVTWSEYVFAKDVDIEFISIVKERSMYGVKFETVSSRQYNTSYAAHLLGRVSAIDPESWPAYKEQGYSMDALVGTSGAELAFEKYLQGTAGTRYIDTNTNGKIVSSTWKIDPATGKELSPQPGYNVVMTLNSLLQEAVENTLATHVPTLPEAEGAAAVVLDVDDASVLALASYPTFDLANFSEVWEEIRDDPLSPMYNRATQGQYAPGSTFKMVTAVAGLEEGIITPYERIRDTGYYTYYTTDPALAPKCWIYRQYGGTHGLLNVSQAITESCNVFFYDTGRRVGIRTLNEYARKFGLGEPTGIELDEKTGVVAGPDYTEGVLHDVWYDGSTLSAAIGQENNQFTPLQLANYVATLVNGGNHHAVHLLKEVKSSDFSQVVYEYQPQLLDTINIDPVNLDAVKKGMLAVTEPGGSVARYFADIDVKVGAKTGSAQVSSETASNAVFVAFAPYDDPEIALCIIVEKGGSGSELGAIAADIISFYFNQEEILSSGQGENTLIR